MFKSGNRSLDGPLGAFTASQAAHSNPPAATAMWRFTGVPKYKVCGLLGLWDGGSTQQSLWKEVVQQSSAWNLFPECCTNQDF
jgi:hypothetical protein